MTLNDITRTPIDIDDDDRPAEAQAADFFAREGDYYEANITIPAPVTAADLTAFARWTDLGFKPGQAEHEQIELVDEIVARYIEARPRPSNIVGQAVLKFTNEQKPIIVETLRQIRGALNARITLTRLNIADEGPAIPMSEFTLGDSSDRNGFPSPAVWTPHLSDDPTLTVHPGLTLSDEAKRQRIAQQHGVPIDHVHPAPSPTGDTAYTITKPTPEAGGRHRKTDQ